MNLMASPSSPSDKPLAEVCAEGPSNIDTVVNIFPVHTSETCTDTNTSMTCTDVKMSVPYTDTNMSNSNGHVNHRSSTNFSFHSLPVLLLACVILSSFYRHGFFFNYKYPVEYLTLILLGIIFVRCLRNATEQLSNFFSFVLSFTNHTLVTSIKSHDMFTYYVPCYFQHISQHIFHMSCSISLVDNISDHTFLTLLQYLMIILCKSCSRFMQNGLTGLHGLISSFSANMLVSNKQQYLQHNNSNLDGHNGRCVFTPPSQSQLNPHRKGTPCSTGGNIIEHSTGICRCPCIQIGSKITKMRSNWSKHRQVPVFSLMFFWLLLPIPAPGFNLDVSRRVVHTGESSSQFGFSVAHHKDSEGIW